VLTAARHDGVIRIYAHRGTRTSVEVTHAEQNLRESLHAGAFTCRFCAHQIARPGETGARDDRSVGFRLDRTREEPQVERRLGERRRQHARFERGTEYRTPLRAYSRRASDSNQDKDQCRGRQHDATVTYSHLLSPISGGPRNGATRATCEPFELFCKFLGEI